MARQPPSREHLNDGLVGISFQSPKPGKVIAYSPTTKKFTVRMHVRSDVDLDLTRGEVLKLINDSRAPPMDVERSSDHPLVGTKVSKRFGRHDVQGTVKNFIPQMKVFEVRFMNGVFEYLSDLGLHEIQGLLVDLTLDDDTESENEGAQHEESDSDPEIIEIFTPSPPSTPRETRSSRGRRIENSPSPARSPTAPSRGRARTRRVDNSHLLDSPSPPRQSTLPRSQSKNRRNNNSHLLSSPSPPRNKTKSARTVSPEPPRVVQQQLSRRRSPDDDLRRNDKQQAKKKARVQESSSTESDSADTRRTRQLPTKKNRARKQPSSESESESDSEDARRNRVRFNAFSYDSSDEEAKKKRRRRERMLVPPPARKSTVQNHDEFACCRGTLVQREETPTYTRVVGGPAEWASIPVGIDHKSAIERTKEQEEHIRKRREFFEARERRRREENEAAQRREERHDRFGQEWKKRRELEAQEEQRRLAEEHLAKRRLHQARKERKRAAAAAAAAAAKERQRTSARSFQGRHKQHVAHHEDEDNMPRYVPRTTAMTPPRVEDEGEIAWC
ncbi:unnamed protein product [Aphanomyces euteiches]|uniref:Uncharacterized protein n=1 Tax=Aphanomyces euteiches TaxID=100861 RepID=A0A6G0W8B0_9STRA|nr:hypothetical protein Ae201684_017716 [Aphanomyces euteiches]KAH9095484.1 hypothetical protein Ae201684P_014550 [Aphanomyces euteiches]KAH9154702.1 hypothetical protein AeRB84_003242 [Aphanomyces euteiches]